MTQSTRHGSDDPTRTPVTRRILFTIVLVTVAGTVAVGVAELVLRVLPIPGINFNTFYYDELTGEHYYPNTTFIYRNARGDYAKRHVNSWGYIDKEHDIEKLPGVVRVGFFGDSFTEARQVPLEETFHRLIEDDLNAREGGPFECIAISMIGYSTLQSYLEYTRWGDTLDLDVVVYVFCENDPGDNVPAVKQSDILPYPRIEGDTLVVDYAFRRIYQRKTRPLHRAWQWLKSHSLVVSTLENRMNLLRRRGVQITVDDDDMAMNRQADGMTGLEPIALPSTWPRHLVDEAERVTEKVIARWQDDVRSSGRRFAILYIPRPLEMAKPRAQQDSWAAWLFELCQRLEIVLIDPTSVFVDWQAAGHELYYDHLARDGHRALARVFVHEFGRLGEQ